MPLGSRSETRKDREVQNLTEENERLRSRLSMLSRLSLQITSSLDLSTALQEIVDAACELIGARYGALGIFDASGHIQEFITHGVTPEEREHIGNLPQGLGLLGLLQQLQQPMRLGDLSRHPRSVGFPSNHPSMKTFLGVPIRYGEEPLGNLYLTEKEGGEEFTPEDENLLVLFASQAAMAIRNARLHQTVEEERSLLDAILTNSPDGITFIDATSGEVRANRRAEEMLGFSFKPSDGLAPLEERCCAADGTPLPLDALPASRALRGELIAGGEHLIRRDDGSSLPILCSAAPIRDSNGGILGAVVQFQDMTSVRAAQQALAESEARHRAILDNSAAVIYIKDTQGRYILINRRYETLFHVNREEIKGKTDYDIFPKEMADSFRANDLKVLQARAPLELEELAPHDDGQHTYISLKVPLYNSAGVPYAVCGISTDITDRKRAEESVDQERKRLEVLVDTSPVGVLLVEATSRRVILVNREAQRILGIVPQADDRIERYEQAAVFKRPDGSIYAVEELPIERALNQGEAVRAEEVRRDFPEGRSIPTLINATPLYAADGRVTGAIAIIQDITPLEEAEKLRNEFLGMVSHELKTPLTAIKGSAATVLGSRRPLDDVEIREFFEIIDEQADRLRDLVDNLLDMTRIEAGSLSVSPEPVDLTAVLEEARATFVRNGNAQELHVEMPDALPQVNADRRRVIQVLLNLLGNAAKFSPANAPIFVEVEHDAAQVTLHVRDQGRGIPKDKASYLFKKFSQVHDDSGRQLSGSGLGLAICKGIVEAHGGRIWADSFGEGEGATFSFTLPLAVEILGAAPPDTARRADHLGRVHRSGERTRILAVDDEPQILRYLQRSLEEAGYQAIVTSNPSEVIKLVELEEPDLVLLDLMLPGTSGFELLQRIREFSGVPAIFLTARDQNEDAVHALKMGADDYITKPFSPSELLARIEAALRRRVLPDLMEVLPPFTLEDLAINFAERRVSAAGRVVSLSATEYKLLYELATHAGRVLTHQQILQRVWGPDYSGETELVRSFIRNLRRKLGDDARRPRFIFTEPQVGYRMPKPGA